MGVHDLPDMYGLSPQTCGPWAVGIYIRQIPCAHITTITQMTQFVKVKSAGYEEQSTNNLVCALQLLGKQAYELLHLQIYVASYAEI